MAVGPLNRSIVSLSVLVAITALLVLAGCSRKPILRIDGSSTVFPITEAVAEGFQQEVGRLRAAIGISGTGGGFQKFCNGEVDIADASRPIKPKEVAACAEAEVDFIELPVAYDGLSVIVSPENDWVDFLTVDELRAIWRPSSSVRRWSDIRPSWPQKSIFLVGADTDSGTFDYFTEVVIGEAGASRADYVASSDDNVLVRAVSEEKFALGYLGYAFLAENPEKLRAVPVDGGVGPVAPSEATIETGEYFPLSRPLFIYVNRDEAQRPEVDRFVRFYLGESSALLIRQVGYVPLPPQIVSLTRQRFSERVTGSIYQGGAEPGRGLEEKLRRD